MSYTVAAIPRVLRFVEGGEKKKSRNNPWAEREALGRA